MAKKPLITEFERTQIAITYNQYKEEKAEFIRQVASKRCGRDLGLSTVQRVLAKLRKEHPVGSTDPLDNQWSLASCKDYPVSPQDIPLLLYIQSTFQDNHPNEYLEYQKRHGNRSLIFLTNRFAIWISRLTPLLTSDPRITDNNEILVPQGVSLPNPNKWPEWLDDLVTIAMAYASYEAGCELAHITPINTAYYDAPSLEQMKINIIMYNRQFLENIHNKTPEEKIEVMKSTKMEDIVRKGGKQNARSYNKKK